MLENRSMDSAHDKIVVYKSYDSGAMANLAKTKLDVYAIPCFLTDENQNNLYPIQSSRVRLHVFQNDLERVQEILSENEPPDFVPCCPACKSLNVEDKDEVAGVLQKITRAFTILIGFTVSLLDPDNSPRDINYFRCKDCNCQF